MRRSAEKEANVREHKSAIFPASWFTLAPEAECEPIHTAACEAAGVSPSDNEISVSWIDDGLRAHWGAECERPVFCYVSETGQQYGAIVYFDTASPEKGFTRLRLAA